jgi:Holliday junction resolvase RusA-like endonuclease
MAARIVMSEVVEVEMPPFGKARPIVTRRGTFMPHDYVDKKEMLRALYLEAGGVYLNTVGAMFIGVDFYFHMPKSWSAKKKKEMDGAWCRKVPDLDNLVGAVMDSLFMDDQNVVMLNAAKYWSYEDRIRIGIHDI